MAARLTPGVCLTDLGLPRRGQPLTSAMAEVPRHLFVGEHAQMRAYLDDSIPLGFGRRCPRPGVVARLLEATSISPGSAVLVLAAGTGYIAAVAAAMGARVDAIEANPDLARRAARALAEAGQAERVTLACSIDVTAIDDGGRWNAVIVAAAALDSGRPLVRLIRPGGAVSIPLRSGRETELAAYGRVQRGHIKRSLGAIDVETITTLPVAGL